MASPPPLQRQLSAYIDRVREAHGGLIAGEGIDEWRSRQSAWDERAAEARAQWGAWPEADADEEDEEIEIEAEPTFYDQTFFKLREVTPLARLIQAFCHRKSVLTTQVVFRFGGLVIGEEDTPESLAMMEGDVIDAVWASDTEVEREREDVTDARIERVAQRGVLAENPPPEQRTHRRQTRHQTSERTGRYMRGEGRCLNVCVESWLEDWRATPAGRDEQAANVAVQSQYVASTGANAAASNASTSNAHASAPGAPSVPAAPAAPAAGANTRQGRPVAWSDSEAYTRAVAAAAATAYQRSAAATAAAGAMGRS